MKSNQAAVRQRVEEILNLRLLGAEFVDIRHHASAAKWNVSDRQLWRYIAAGDKILKETLEKDREKLVNRHVAMRRALYARAVSVSDYSTALRVLDSEAKILGLADAELSAIVEKLTKEIEEIKRGNTPKAIS
jgi:hypothetical protein